MSKHAQTYIVGIVGATGAVGVEIIKCLKEREFPLSEIHLYSSAKSSGTVIVTSLGDKIVQEYSLEHARLCQIIFLAVSGEFSLANARLLAAGDGPVVIDNSSAWRYNADVPLVVRVLSFYWFTVKRMLSTSHFLYELHKNRFLKLTSIPYKVPS